MHDKFKLAIINTDARNYAKGMRAQFEVDNPDAPVEYLDFIEDIACEAHKEVLIKIMNRQLTK